MKISVLTPSIRPEGLQIVKECLARQTFTDFEWLVEIGLGLEHDLNRAYNKMLKRSTGELIVFYQDFIKIEDDGLQKFWDEYTSEYFMTAPVGKSLDYTDPKWDWRHFKHEDIGFQGWEIDWGACPREALFKLGGFDEELDKNWSFDNVNVAYRAQLAGYKFKCIDNPSIALDHDVYMPHPFRERYNPTFNNERLREFDHGTTLNYLNNNTQ